MLEVPYLCRWSIWYGNAWSGPEALRPCMAPHIYGSEWQASLWSGEGPEDGPLEKNSKRFRWQGKMSRKLSLQGCVTVTGTQWKMSHMAIRETWGGHTHPTSWPWLHSYMRQGQPEESTGDTHAVFCLNFSRTTDCTNAIPFHLVFCNQYLWHLLADSAHSGRRPCKAKVPFLTVCLVSFLIVLHVPAPTFTECSWAGNDLGCVRQFLTAVYHQRHFLS